MMDKKPHIKPYLYGMLAGFGAIALSIIFFFLIYRFDGFGDAISTLTGILMPFIYGAVIAYLLKPVCNTIESFLRRFIPEKMHGLVNVLSITLTILFGLLLIYALCMMIIPQLITSVTTLYYTAQRNLAKFVQWANHVEFIENNQQIMDMLNSAYATISTNIDDLIKTRLLPSIQNIVSGAAIGVLNVVTVAKNLVIGIIVALVIGKPLGIMITAWLSTHVAGLTMAKGLRVRDMFPAACACGIGFTVSFLIASLAYTNTELSAEGRFGVLMASLIAALISGILLSRQSKRFEKEELESVS